MRLASLFLLLFCLQTSLSSQTSVEEFRLGGSAYVLNDECIRLTPDAEFRSGSAWYEKAIDLRQPFELTLCLVLGENDDLGADGIAFVFTPRATTGYRGEGMGFAGLVPSVGIEFDTYQNYHLGDPAEDHVAIAINGQPHHYASVDGPNPVGNLEDGNKHLLFITWDPYDQQLMVTLDGKLRAQLGADLVKEVFGGNPQVYWGVTAATGRKTNYQDICIKKLKFASVD